jgi:hypothetical protein
MAMSEQSVEEIVEEMEAAHSGSPNALHWYTSRENLCALIADWRKRGEALAKERTETIDVGGEADKRLLNDIHFFPWGRR